MRDLFAALDAYLIGPYQTDTWSESSIDFAQEMLRAFDEPAWETLESAWPDRPEDWQVRLAETAFSADPRRGIPLLVEMVKRGILPVALAAAESLEGRNDLYTPDASILPYLRDIARQVNRASGQTVEALIARAVVRDDVRDPKVVVVVNVREDEDGDVSVVHGVVTKAGVDADFAFTIADLEVYVQRDECDIGVVNLSFPSAARDVANLLKGVARPPLLASMKFFRRADTEAPEWAVRHIVYGSAEQFAEELATLVREFEARRAER